MVKYRRKEVVEAVQFRKDNIKGVLEFTTNIGELIEHENGGMSLNLLTRSGLMKALENDWVIKYPNPVFRFGVLSPEDFTEIYEPVEEPCFS